MDLASVGAASIEMHLSQLQQSVDVSMAKKAMDLQEAQMQTLLSGMPAAQPFSGHLLDTRA